MQEDRAVAGLELTLATAARLGTMGCICLPANTSPGTHVPSLLLGSSLGLPHPPFPSAGGNNPSGPLLSVDSDR